MGTIPYGEIVGTADERVIMRNVRWDQFEAMVAFRGDASSPRFAYLEGNLEIMSPSRSHETIKSLIGALVELYAFEKGLDFTAVGSWLLKDAPKARGLEPDECYIVGDQHKDRPDLAIEVVWTSGGLDKLDIYRGLGVREVWIVKDGKVTVHRLESEAYVEIPGSEVFAGIDLELVMRLVDEPTTSAAMRKMRDALRG